MAGAPACRMFCTTWPFAWGMNGPGSPMSGRIERAPIGATATLPDHWVNAA
jgi:hypothetical protein